MRKGFIVEGIGCLIGVGIIMLLLIPACCCAISDISSRRMEKQTVTETVVDGQTNRVTVIEYKYD